MHPQATVSVDDPSATEASYLVVHRVQCDERGNPNHEEHEAELDYLDVPRLFADANQTSSLKGTEPLERITQIFTSPSSTSTTVPNITGRLPINLCAYHCLSTWIVAFLDSSDRTYVY
jgi:hypothetical protein